MSRTDTYLADYELINAQSEEQSSRLASNEAMVGSALTLKEHSEDYTYEVFSEQGGSLGFISPQNKLAFKSAFDQSKVKCITLSLVYYSNDDKQFMGELAYQFYTPDPNAHEDAQAFSNFFKHTQKLIEEGKRPQLQISAYEHDYIKDNNGALEITKATPLPEFSKGEVVFKKQKSIADKMVQGLVSGTPQDRIKVYALVILVILIIIALIYFLFLR